MSKDMKKKIGFVIVSGNKFSNIAPMLKGAIIKSPKIFFLPFWFFINWDP